MQIAVKKETTMTKMNFFKKKKIKDKGIAFPFKDKRNAATISCKCVLKDGQSIRYACHDNDDGMWQFLCGNSHESDDAMVVALEEVYQHDPSLSSIADLPLGYEAERKDEKSDWIIRSISGKYFVTADEGALCIGRQQ